MAALSVLVAVLVALLTAVLLVFLAYSVYLVTLHRQYAHIPQPKGASFYFGHIPVIRKWMSSGGLLYDLSLKWCDEVGPTYVMWVFYRASITSAELESIKRLSASDVPKAKMLGMNYIFGQRFIKESLLTIQTYEEWKGRRKTFDPSFTKSFLTSLVPQFNKVAKQHLIDDLRSVADGQTVVDMSKKLGNTTLQMISIVAFGTDFSKDQYVQSLAGEKGLMYLLDNTLKGMMASFRNPIGKYIVIGQNRSYAQTALKVRQIGEYCIRNRLTALENKQEVPHDILTLILQTVHTNKTLDIEELVDEFVTFYLAGQETTANLLSFCVALLLQHPDLLHRVMEEIDEVVGDKTSVEADDLDKLTYMHQVFEETLRLYPPAGSVVKKAPPGLVLGGYTIPTGTMVGVPIYLMHHLPKYYDDPLVFNPSRFDPDQKRPSPYVYIPFGIGHRTCIGKVFAMMEAKVIMVHLLTNYQLTLSEGYKLEAIQLATLRPKHGVPCTLTPR